MWHYVSGRWSFFGTSALLDPPVSPVTVRALSDLLVLSIPREAFLEVLAEEPAVGYRMLRDHSHRLLESNRDCVETARRE